MRVMPQEMISNDWLTVYHGDCRDVLASLPSYSVDSVVTDPPYELAFMGKKWDATGIAYDPVVWGECLRVLKPGGHLLAFGGTRTWHRLAVAIEDAGFEVRDSIAWMYGSGFPKSLDVSKAIDKAAGVQFSESPAEGVGFMNPAGKDGYNVTKNKLTRVGESTPAAKKWQGWGTALKPAHEPVVVARKPLIGTVAENVLAHGTGALNIDGCRIESGSDYHDLEVTQGGDHFSVGSDAKTRGTKFQPSSGRWPANVILDESQAAELDRQADELPARFFYIPKANKKERPRHGETAHPTVKPINLMRYLVRLATPPNGILLDPFAGSGATLEAAFHENINAIGIELTDDYLPLIKIRVDRCTQPGLL